MHINIIIRKETNWWLDYTIDGLFSITISRFWKVSWNCSPCGWRWPSSAFKTIYFKFHHLWNTPRSFLNLKQIRGRSHHNGTLKKILQLAYNKISMKTKLLQNRFVGTFGTLKLYEKVIALLGFTPYCDWKSTNPIHAFSPGANPSGELTNLSTVD